MSYKILRDWYTEEPSISLCRANITMYEAYMSGDVNLTTSYQDILSIASVPASDQLLVIANIYEDLSSVTAVSTAPVSSEFDLHVGGLLGEAKTGTKLPILAAAIAGPNAGMRTFVWRATTSSPTTIKVQGKLTNAGSVTGNWAAKQGESSTYASTLKIFAYLK